MSTADNERMVGIKEDIGKPKWNLLPLKAVEQVVRVFTFGAAKYGENNWRHLANPQKRYSAAALRHITAWQEGEYRDPESGIHHLAHAACNLIFILAFEREEW